MDLRLDIERRKRFAGREREDKRSPGGSRGPSRDRSSEKSGKRHKKSKYVSGYEPFCSAYMLALALLGQVTVCVHDQSSSCPHDFNVAVVCVYRKAKRKRDRSPSSSSSSSSPSPFPPHFKGKEYMGEGVDHPEEGYTFTRYPPQQDYSGPADRGPRDYEGHNPERGRGRGFVSVRSRRPRVCC